MSPPPPSPVNDGWRAAPLAVHESAKQWGAAAATPSWRHAQAGGLFGPPRSYSSAAAAGGGGYGEVAGGRGGAMEAELRALRTAQLQLEKQLAAATRLASTREQNLRRELLSAQAEDSGSPLHQPRRTGEGSVHIAGNGRLGLVFGPGPGDVGAHVEHIVSGTLAAGAAMSSSELCVGAKLAAINGILTSDAVFSDVMAVLAAQWLQSETDGGLALDGRWHSIGMQFETPPGNSPAATVAGSYPAPPAPSPPSQSTAELSAHAALTHSAASPLATPEPAVQVADEQAAVSAAVSTATTSSAAAAATMPSSMVAAPLMATRDSNAVSKPTKAVEPHGKGSVLATKAGETQGKGSVVPSPTVASMSVTMVPSTEPDAPLTASLQSLPPGLTRLEAAKWKKQQRLAVAADTAAVPPSSVLDKEPAPPLQTTAAVPAPALSTAGDEVALPGDANVEKAHAAAAAAAAPPPLPPTEQTAEMPPAKMSKLEQVKLKREQAKLAAATAAAVTPASEVEEVAGAMHPPSIPTAPSPPLAAVVELPAKMSKLEAIRLKREQAKLTAPATAPPLGLDMPPTSMAVPASANDGGATAAPPGMTKMQQARWNREQTRLSAGSNPISSTAPEAASEPPSGLSKLEMVKWKREQVTRGAPTTSGTPPPPQSKATAAGETASAAGLTPAVNGAPPEGLSKLKTMKLKREEAKLAASAGVAVTMAAQHESASETAAAAAAKRSVSPASPPPPPAPAVPASVPAAGAAGSALPGATATVGDVVVAELSYDADSGANRKLEA